MLYSLCMKYSCKGISNKGQDSKPNVISTKTMVDDVRHDKQSCNVLEVEHNEYLGNNDNLKATHMLPTGMGNYKQLQLLWIEGKMQTFSAYLRHYNNRDVQPFVQAVQKMLTKYASKGIDMFISSISVPGIAKNDCLKVAG